MLNIIALALILAPGFRWNKPRYIGGLDSFVLTHITVIDVRAGVARPGMTLVVTGDRISDVGPAGQVSVPEGARVIDATGKFLIPGLWDMHVHWYDKDLLKLFTANGVTGVRQMFGFPTHLEWRRELSSGSLLGPRMAIASPIVDGPRPMWPNSIAVSSAGDGRKAVEKVKRWGADFVKVYSFLPRDAYLAIADEAKKEGIPFEGHVPWSVSAAEASDAGQKSIEHLTGILLACSAREAEIRKQIPQATPFAGHAGIEAQALETYDPKKATELFERFVKNGTWQCPTLTVLRSSAYLDDKDFRNDRRTKYMPAQLRERWERREESRFGNRNAANNYSTAKVVYPRYLELVGKMNRAGVQIMAGTDTGNPYCFPGFSLHDELALLVKAGLTAAEALRSATLNPAKFLDMEDRLGTIEKGKFADMVLLDANPLEDIHNTQKIDAVVQNGHLLDRKALDKMLGPS
jgi:imidazolonepropionase-like amidohydrolase